MPLVVKKYTRVHAQTKHAHAKSAKSQNRVVDGADMWPIVAANFKYLFHVTRMSG